MLLNNEFIRSDICDYHQAKVASLRAFLCMRPIMQRVHENLKRLGCSLCALIFNSVRESRSRLFSLSTSVNPAGWNNKWGALAMLNSDLLTRRVNDSGRFKDLAFAAGKWAHFPFVLLPWVETLERANVSDCPFNAFKMKWKGCNTKGRKLFKVR